MIDLPLLKDQPAKDQPARALIRKSKDEHGYEGVPVLTMLRRMSYSDAQYTQGSSSMTQWHSASHAGQSYSRPGSCG